MACKYMMIRLVSVDPKLRRWETPFRFSCVAHIKGVHHVITIPKAARKHAEDNGWTMYKPITCGGSAAVEPEPAPEVIEEPAPEPPTAA